MKTGMPGSLFVDLAQYKPLPPGEALRVIAHGSQVDIINSIEAAVKVLQSGMHYRIVVVNGPDSQILNLARKIPLCQTVVVSPMAIPEISGALAGQEDQLIDHLIAHYDRAGWVVEQLRICLQKILTANIFGVDKYLIHGTAIQRFPIRGSGDRNPLNMEVMKFAQKCGLGQHLSKTLFGISEELLMNVLYDAPLASGTYDPSTFNRNSPVELAPHEQGELTFGCDGQCFVLAASDPFGALKRGTFFAYLEKIMKRDDTQGLIDTKKEGAGLGFFKMLYGCNALICDVKAMQKTEVMALLDLREPVRDFSMMPRSVHFFQI